MASAPKLDADPKSSLAEKGEKPKSPVVAPIFSSRPPSPAAPDTAVRVPETEEEKGRRILAQAMGLGGKKKKTRKQKKRAQKKTQKRRGRK